MASINVLNIIPKTVNNKFTDGFKFEIVFEVLSELKKEIEWKMVYIGSANDPKLDQELESVEIGPLQLGTMKFELEGEAPDASKIPKNDIVGVTALLLCCSYNNQEFFRCGYYINNFYANEELAYNPPEEPDINLLSRSLLADKPRITVFSIDWDDEKANKSEVENELNNDFMFKDGKMNQEDFEKLKNTNNNNCSFKNESNKSQNTLPSEA